MEMLILVDACRRASASRITTVVPYFGYARQDRKAKARDPISAKLVANLITSAGADRVLTMDLHATQIQGFFDIPLDHMEAASLFADYYMKKFPDTNDVVVVSPDSGSVTRARKFAERMGMGLAILDKRRDSANQVEMVNIIGNVEGMRVILYDDIVDTAGSFCEAVLTLAEGGAKEIYGCATHGVLSGAAIERIKSCDLKELVFTDTIPFPGDKMPSKIKYISAAPLFAEAIERIFQEVSISSLVR
jgi:ribose-phosphate pyrophosphokinase